MSYTNTNLNKSSQKLNFLYQFKNIFFSSITFFTVVISLLIVMIFQVINDFGINLDGFYVGVAVLIMLSFLVAYYLRYKGILGKGLFGFKSKQVTETFLIQKIEQLEEKLLESNSFEVKEPLIEEVNVVKLKLLSLQINDATITKVQELIERQGNNGILNALDLIERNSINYHADSIPAQMNKKSKIACYKAGLYTCIHQWEKADSMYLEAIEFAPNSDNYFKYAYFLHVYRDDFEQADRFYRIVLEKSTSQTQRATVLSSLAWLYKDNNAKQVEVVEMYEDVLKLYKSLAEENPAVYVPYLAKSFNNLGNFYAKDSTKRDEALGMYEEALSLHRVLAQENFETYLPELADTLNSLGNFYADDSGKRVEALNLYKEALKVRQGLAKENSKAYLPEVAESLNNLGLFYSKDSTKRSEALKMYQKALRIRRKLAKRNPKVYLPYVAGSLNNLGLFYSNDSKKQTQALNMYEEALTVRRRLAKDNPKGYLADVAGSLNNLGLFHSKDSMRRAETLSLYEEALDIYRELAQKNPKVYLPYVGGSLNNLAAFYAEDSTQQEEAFSLYKEALKIYRELAKENPEVYGRDCANTLVMGVDLFNVSKANLEEALDLLAAYPDSYMNVGWLQEIIAQLKEKK